jgi:hypothetical protein
MKFGAVKRYLSSWRKLISVRDFPRLFSYLYEILCKRNAVNSKLHDIWRGQGIAFFFYGRKLNDIYAPAIKLYGRLKGTS